MSRKFVLLLPLMMIPLLTLFVWALGSGPSIDRTAFRDAAAGLLNTQLPDAHNDEHQRWTKLDYYKQADADSAKKKAAAARDPYYQAPELQAERLTERLEQLQRRLQEPAPVIRSSSAKIRATKAEKPERLPSPLQAPPAPADPEIAELNGLLDKLISLQDPERKEKRAQDSTVAYTAAIPDRELISEWTDSSAMPVSVNGFYSMDEPARALNDHPSFAAVIAEKQTLVSGGVIQLRLSEDMNINGVIVPADQLVYGIAQVNNERLLIDIEQIRVDQLLLPVHLSVYDLDGLPGLSVPGALARSVAKQSLGASTQQIGLLSMAPSVGAQAAGAGIQAAKSLLHKKVQQIKVTVNSGYAVLLKNDARVR